MTLKEVKQGDSKSFMVRCLGIGPCCSPLQRRLLAFAQLQRSSTICAVPCPAGLPGSSSHPAHSYPPTNLLNLQGIFKTSKEDLRWAGLWVNAGGHVMGLDRPFSDKFGWAHKDLALQHIASIGADDSVGANFAIVADKLKKVKTRTGGGGVGWEPGAAGLQCLLEWTAWVGSPAVVYDACLLPATLQKGSICRIAALELPCSLWCSGSTRSPRWAKWCTPSPCECGTSTAPAFRCLARPALRARRTCAPCEFGTGQPGAALSRLCPLQSSRRRDDCLCIPDPALPASTTVSHSGSLCPACSRVRFLLDERVESLGLVSVNPAGAIVYCNATFESMLGFEPGKRAVGAARLRTQAHL